MPVSRPERRCARCRRAARARSRLCGSCRDGLAALLSELPGLYGTIERGARAAEARSAVRGVLASWVHVVVGGRAVPRPVRSVAELAGFLHRHVDWLGAHPAVAEIVAEFGDLAARLRHASCAQCDLAA